MKLQLLKKIQYTYKECVLYKHFLNYSICEFKK